MATTTLREVLDVGAKISGSEVRQVQELFEILPGRDSNLVPLIGYGESVRLDDTMKHEWIVDEYLPHFVTVNNGAGYADSATSIVVDDADVVQVGDLLKIGDETARITAITSGSETLTISRSVGANAAEAIVDHQELYIMPGSHLDTDTFPTSPTLRGEFTSNYPQQFMYSFEETAMASARTNYLTMGEEELMYTEKKHMVEADRRLAQALLYNEKVQPTSSVPGQFDGFDAMITDNVNTSVGLLTATKLVNLLDLLWADAGNMGELTVLLSHNTKRVVDAVLNAQFARTGETNTTSVGVTMDSFSWNGGVLNFTLEHFVRDGHIFFLRPDKLDINPLDVRLEGLGSGWQRVSRSVEHNNALKRSNLYWGLFTTRMTDERLHGKMKGITTTLSSYPGAV